MTSGTIFHIQRYSLHDGPGIRTSVFLKGCPLRCAWCHNPEGIAFELQLSYDAARCVGCGTCAGACALGLHALDAGVHTFAREACTHCSACCDVCPTGALERIGQRLSVEEVLDVVRRDLAYYRAGGGMTLTGGEPMAQPEFAIALAAKAQAEGINVCVETSGAASQANLLAMAAHCQLFLYDIKETQPDLHLRYTGAELDPILDNLFALDARGVHTILRCPVIPGYNDRPKHIDALAELSGRLAHLQAIQLLPYHPLGVEKYHHIGAAPAALPIPPMDHRTLQDLADRLVHRARVPVQCEEP